MADQWYYGAEGSRQGPFTSRELLELATSGRLQPSDTVWKAGVSAGVPAHRVKNLFPAGATPPAPETPTPEGTQGAAQEVEAAAPDKDLPTPAEAAADSSAAETSHPA